MNVPASMRSGQSLTVPCFQSVKVKGPLFNPKVTGEWKESQMNLLGKRFDYLACMLSGKQYLMGDTFTVADAYLFTALNWTNFFKLDLGNWPVLKDYMARVAARPAVKEAMKAEGLIP